MKIETEYKASRHKSCEDVGAGYILIRWDCKKGSLGVYAANERGAKECEQMVNCFEVDADCIKIPDYLTGHEEYMNAISGIGGFVKEALKLKKGIEMMQGYA